MLLPRRKEKEGFILVLVLGMLVLITVLVIAFLGHVTAQSKSSTSYRDQTDTLVLGDTAVNIVKAQIDTATAAAGTTPPGLWASQPGAIRTISSTGTQTTYKLYSSAALTDANLPGATLKADILNDLPTAADAHDWSSSALWTDLNAPAIKSDGTYAYPIVDVVNDLVSADFPAGTTATAPFATGNFNIDSTPANNPIGASRSAAATSPLPSNAPLPMPVRWLYVLKQGQVIAPDSTSTATKLTFNNALTKPVSTPGNPVTDNPIVGRIAFWTDDDTCRVNINTASNGTFYDTPRFTSTLDYAFSTIQPVNKEYQRYPGHAAMTTLALALPEFSTNPEALIGLTPRYNPGGSTEGTVQTFTALTAKANRLYDSVDELLFDPPAASQGARTASAYLSKKQVETAKFFLTAHSRAPELNLFGEPRVSMWPISSLNNATGKVYQTATDQLLAFCSTTPGATTTSPYAYYFTRAPYVNGGTTGSNSPTADVSIARNVQLLTYLDNLTSQVLPGNLSGTAAFGGTTAATVKYTQLGMRQILTEIFDYIRITNARDPNLDPNVTPGGVPYAAAGSIGGTSAAQINSQGAGINGVAGNPGDGQILPTYNSTWGTYGYGRFSGRITEAALIFVGVGQGISGTTYSTSPYNFEPITLAQWETSESYPPAIVPTGTPPNAPPAGTYTPPPNNTAVQAFLALSFFDPALGWSPANPNFTITVSGLGNLSLGGSALNFGDPASEQISNILQGLNNYSMESQLDNERPGDLGSMMDFRVMCGKRELINGGTTLNWNWFPFFSSIVNVPNNSGPTTLSGGGLVTINVYPGSSSTSVPTGTPIHTYTLDFSKLDGKMVVPSFSPRPIFGTIRTIANSGGVAKATPPSVPPTTANTTDRFDDWNTHGEDYHQQQIDYIIDSFDDTVLSLVPTSTYGDYRMLAPYSSAVASTNPLQAGTAFQAHPNVNLTAPNQLAYGFEYSGGQYWPGSTQGTLVNVSPAYWSGQYSYPNPGSWGSIPLVPATVVNPTSGGTAAPPDFDNGFGDLPDGAYINKPDEGAVYPPGNQLGSTSLALARPYFDNRQETSQYYPQYFFSPQRQVPSPVMFGSLPTGAPVGTLPAKPWQTLLFQPGATGHAGLAAPKDEYLLDLFWMPQSEPYAISEPFSTAGKINLNYQILPFTYIDRSTAIQSVLSSEMVAEVSSKQAAIYKEGNGGTGTISNARLPLYLSEKDGTLSQFVQRFTNLDFFRAPAEICDVYLIPQGQSWAPDPPTGSAPFTYTDTAAQTAFYGTAFALVGDNTREKPYADIYSRITTKSNTFTVYYRAEALKNPPGVNAAQWTEGQGVILGDYRGSTSLERYIDPNDNTIPDYATANAGTPNLETHYKWRVVENTRFSP